MPIVTLRDLFIAELQDLLDAEQQIVEELPALSAKATSGDLARVLNSHLEQTRVHVQRLDLILQQLGVQRAPAPCEAIRGLIAEGRRRLADTERGEVMDAAIIGIAQRVEHYEMAGYGCARAYAHTLDDHGSERILQQTLDEEGRADHLLSALAEQQVNRSAGDDDSTAHLRIRSRLRYVGADDLPEFHYREYRILNHAGEDLGTLDGFILDSRSGRPLYYVVDSGGWFVGRRYVVPIGRLDADEPARALRTELDRTTLKQYPQFTPSAFLAMDDFEARRFEHRLLAAVAPERARAGRLTPPTYDEMPEYRPPTWLMTGMWLTDNSGFAAAPPRATPDMPWYGDDDRTPPATRTTTPVHESYPENELMMARGEPEDRADEQRRPVPDSGEIHPRETETPKSSDPRIERYRDR